eukprot:CAMPEP_0114536554 /NCGR_PEP_ID=MMETSP0109-20121206/29077_1 /TAXON_ID=29199 /ORGANISM="Chlorarachnion reptans, Strain CCCM449" /LENGTH=146 /DNA_ID=CAMNT_0001720325 /DNA_START=233 /DNA_END=670 /DNA_ORIENTATION=-
MNRIEVVEASENEVSVSSLFIFCSLTLVTRSPESRIFTFGSSAPSSSSGTKSPPANSGSRGSASSSNFANGFAVLRFFPPPFLLTVSLIVRAAVARGLVDHAVAADLLIVIGILVAAKEVRVQLPASLLHELGEEPSPLFPLPGLL